MRDHRKLRAFELADALALQVYQATAEFPKSEQFGLASQMRRAAVSIPCNIVEGCARPSEADFLRFLDIAYGSTRELEYQISLALRLGFLHDERHAALAAQCEEASKVLHGLIRSLRSS
jgi:four helix bundle protein